MVTATNGSTLSFQPLVLVEQKVKVSLPSASTSLLTDCIACGPRPRYQSSHFHTSCSSAAAWLARLAMLAQALLVGKRRAVSLRRPPPPPPPELSKAVCGNGYEGHGAVHPPSFPSRPRFLPEWTGSASSGGESGLLPDTQMVAA